MKLFFCLSLVSSLLLSACHREDSATTAAAPSVSEASNAGNYPLDTCVVSGEKLGSMGKPYIITYEGQEVRLCCKSCQGHFQEDPGKYLAKLKLK
ncbi:hypothetical protein SAMN02745166_02975 [Prosthecobacter debontii]|uniref:YHS domain-containing protein n=1 Tax=Prosthecobacter debontii TaxID=48467 RepID=A0A1T4YE97_9BACT|nr:hypothetical protein [Prosthecobacter debontii]SKA99575.1 hypothetical protein SAMN02745166_02975 [Prosthecobacter debontii]